MALTLFGEGKKVKGSKVNERKGARAWGQSGGELAPGRAQCPPN